MPNFFVKNKRGQYYYEKGGFYDPERTNYYFEGDYIKIFTDDEASQAYVAKKLESGEFIDCTFITTLKEPHFYTKE